MRETNGRYFSLVLTWAGENEAIRSGEIYLARVRRIRGRLTPPPPTDSFSFPSYNKYYLLVLVLFLLSLLLCLPFLIDLASLYVSYKITAFLQKS